MWKGLVKNKQTSEVAGISNQVTDSEFGETPVTNLHGITSKSLSTKREFCIRLTL